MADLLRARVDRGHGVRHLGVESLGPGRLVGQRPALEILQDLDPEPVELGEIAAVAVGDRPGDGDPTDVRERVEEWQLAPSLRRPGGAIASGDLHEGPAAVAADRHVAPRIDPVGHELEAADIEPVPIPEETHQGLAVDVRLGAHPPTLRSAV